MTELTTTPLVVTARLLVEEDVEPLMQVIKRVSYVSNTGQIISRRARGLKPFSIHLGDD